MTSLRGRPEASSQFNKLRAADTRPAGPPTESGRLAGCRARVRRRPPRRRRSRLGPSRHAGDSQGLRPAQLPELDRAAALAGSGRGPREPPPPPHWPGTPRRLARPGGLRLSPSDRTVDPAVTEPARPGSDPASGPPVGPEQRPRPDIIRPVGVWAFLRHQQVTQTRPGRVRPRRPRTRMRRPNPSHESEAAGEPTWQAQDLTQITRTTADKRVPEPAP